VAEVDRALEDCLSALHDGRALQDVLRRHPRRREELISILQLSLDLAQLRTPAPETGFRLRARNRMLAAAQRGRSLRRAPFNLALRLRPVLVGAAAVAAAAAVSAGGLTAAAAGSLPGEPLYSVKTAVEGVELRLTLDPQASARLRLQFAQRRLDEAERLARLGRAQEAVDLAGAYASAVSADAPDRDLEAGRMAADEALRRLAGTLSAAGNAEAASTVDQERNHLDEAMANRGAHHEQTAGAKGDHPDSRGGTPAASASGAPSSGAGQP
jgi:uncharacterized protein DUF5667